MWRGTILETGLHVAQKAIGLLSRVGLVGLALIVSIASAATADDAPEACSSKPYVVKIHADWCGSCRAIESVWERIKSDLRDQATAVTLDVSDRVAYTESQAVAERLGISEFFQEYRSRTGTIAVLDCRSRKPVAVMSAERDLEKYREAIVRAGGAS
jgi:thiol-disulfide isomerase/thioredoxin